MKKVLIAVLTMGMAQNIYAKPMDLKACVGCHGANFEKAALGKSKVVSEMTKEEISQALVGYKKGTYGGPMKGLMKGQVMKYSEEELTAAAAEIKK